MRFLMCVAAFALVFTGCKGKDGAEGDKAGAATADSSKSNHDKWQGSWSVDIEKMIELDPKAKEQMAKNPEMADMMKKMLGAATFEIGKDSLKVTGMGPKEDKATYTVKSQDGNKLVIESKDEGKEELEIITITFTDDNSVILTKDGEEDKMPLKRKK